MNVLAIGAHPDDIEFGCGGTLLKLKSQGHKIYMLVMTCGEHGGSSNQRKCEQSKVAEYIGVEEVLWGGQEDTRIPVNDFVISLIDDTIRRTGAELVLFNHAEDTHQDHRSLARCAISATRYAKWALAYEVPSSAQFEPTLFVDIESTIDRKMELLNLHASQRDKTRVPHLTIVESARACALFRGYQGKVKFAEGFMPVRYLLDWQ
jgi:LmbE family N-acetylglucosaminyl deacetylase